MTTQTIEGDSRERIARFLPDAIAQALRSYHRFSEQSVPEDAKGFAAHHSACKVAVAHIELLIKLARWADLPDAAAQNANDQIILAAMVEQAEKELMAYHEKEDHDE